MTKRREPKVVPSTVRIPVTENTRRLARALWEASRLYGRTVEVKSA
jgi:hypothetical protein